MGLGRSSYENYIARCIIYACTHAIGNLMKSQQEIVSYAGTNLQSADVLVSKPNWSTLITETLAVLQKPGFLDQDEAVKVCSLYPCHQ